MNAGHIETIARGVFVKDGSLLLCHSKGAPNTYLPGGHVDFLEKAEHSLTREIKEELGLAAAVGRFLGAVQNAFIQEGAPHAEINLVFEMDIPGIDPSRDPESMEDYIEFCWQPIDALAESVLEPSVLRQLIPEWITGATPSQWATCGDQWL